MVERTQPENRQESKVIVVLGPTATGKTGRAVSLSRAFDGEIISADSRQVYRDMTIGTGKDLEEYGEVKYHLIDICEAGEKYNLHRYIRDFRKALHDIRERGKQPIVCGGTGMYLENAMSGIDLPEVEPDFELREHLSGKSLEELTEILKRYKTLHNTTDIDTAKRAIRAIEIEEYYRRHPEEANRADRKKAKPLDSVLIGIDIPREERRERISKRLKSRLQQGMLDEGLRLWERGLGYEGLAYYGLEYKFMADYFMGLLTYEDMVKNLETAIHQFAKRQMTWFRGMERRGFKINWLPYDMSESQFISAVESLIKNEEK